MSEPRSALGHAAFDGFARIREIGPLGMITLRASTDLPALANAVKEVLELEFPAIRRIVAKDDRAIAWMSPDEWLLILPYADVAGALAKLHKALKEKYVLAIDVSDARAVFRVEGPLAAEVLMKLSPIDHKTLAPGEVRRTRAAQVACALWRDDTGYTLVSFRSVAVYVMALLTQAAQPGGEVGLR